MVILKRVYTVLLRDRWKNVRTVLAPQSDLKNTGPLADTVHK